MRLHNASGRMPSRPSPVTKRISRRSVTRSIPSPLSLSPDPTPQRENSSWANVKTSSPWMSSITTTAICARPLRRSESQARSIAATALSDNIPSGFDVYLDALATCTFGTSLTLYVRPSADAVKIANSSRVVSMRFIFRNLFRAKIRKKWECS